MGVRRRCPNDGDELEESGCEGMMVLDRESHPNWKLCCNKCNKIIRFTANIHDIQVLKMHCEECNASLVKVVFNKLNSPLPDGQLEYIAEEEAGAEAGEAATGAEAEEESGRCSMTCTRVSNTHAT